MPADAVRPTAAKKNLQYVHARRAPAASRPETNSESERLRAENEALRKSYEDGKRMHAELQQALAAAANLKPRADPEVAGLRAENERLKKACEPRPDPEIRGLRAENERLKKAYEDGRRQFAELKESAMAARKPEPRKDSDRQLAAERDRKDSELKAIVAGQAADLAAARRDSETHRSARAVADRAAETHRAAKVAAERDAESLRADKNNLERKGAELRAKLAASRDILESVGKTLELCVDYHRKDPASHMHAALADARNHVRCFASTL